MVQLKVIIFLLYFLSTIPHICPILFNFKKMFACIRDPAVMNANDDDDDYQPKPQPIEQKHWRSVQPVQTILKENVMAVVPVSPVEADKKVVVPVTTVEVDQTAENYIRQYVAEAKSAAKTNSVVKIAAEIQCTYNITSPTTPEILTDGRSDLLTENGTLDVLTDSGTLTNDLLQLEQVPLGPDLIDLGSSFHLDGSINKTSDLSKAVVSIDPLSEIEGLDLMVTDGQAFGHAQANVSSILLPLQTTNPFVDIPEGITNAMAHYDNHNRSDIYGNNNVSYAAGNQQMIIRPSSAELRLATYESNAKAAGLEYVFTSNLLGELNPFKTASELTSTIKEVKPISMNDEKKLKMQTHQSAELPSLNSNSIISMYASEVGSTNKPLDLSVYPNAVGGPYQQSSVNPNGIGVPYQQNVLEKITENT